MNGDRHFSHNHPLTPFIGKEGDEDYVGDDKSHLCKICGLPILTSSSFTCTTVTCEFFLHESCALKFHKRMIHPNHDPFGAYFINLDKHTLHLHEGSPHFIYKCVRCGFHIHPMVAAPVVGVEIKIKHKSHPSHPLYAIPKKHSCECDACGKIHEGFFFSCQQCNFWIHQDCTILPTAVTITPHPYPFILAYSFPVRSRESRCIVCYEPLILNHNAIYFCPQTTQFAHASCGKNSQSKTILGVTQLPDDDWDTFPSFQRYSSLTIVDEDADDDDGMTIEKFHNHPLIPVGDHYKYKEMSEKYDDVDDHHQICNVCIQTINISSSSPFYRCAQGDCLFLAHKVCTDLLPKFKFAIPFTYAGIKAPDPTASFFNSIFICSGCFLPCNGPLHYYPHISIRGDINTFLPLSPLYLDLLCMAAPIIIKHTSHTKHLLYRIFGESASSPVACCSDYTSLFNFYKCIACNFYIHLRCAVLPKRVRFHDYDKHPLDLIVSSDGEICSYEFCEVCEKVIDPKYWFYGCGECEQSFHINCIPSVGYLSRVKFGGTLSIPSFHHHPLTLTRMLTIERHEKCGYCHKIIRGLVDQIALCCSKECGFWIHASCARDGSESLYQESVRVDLLPSTQMILHQIFSTHGSG